MRSSQRPVHCCGTHRKVLLAPVKKTHCRCLHWTACYVRTRNIWSEWGICNHAWVTGNDALGTCIHPWKGWRMGKVPRILHEYVVDKVLKLHWIWQRLHWAVKRIPYWFVSIINIMIINRMIKPKHQFRAIDWHISLLWRPFSSSHSIIWRQHYIKKKNHCNLKVTSSDLLL